MVKTIEKKLCVALLIFVIVLSGCDNTNKVVNYQETSSPITSITFFGNKYESENVTVIEEIITNFMEENPDIQVSYESVKGSEYYEVLEKRMAAGKGDDVFMVNHDIVLRLKEKNQLADLSGLDTISSYTGQMLNQMKSDGKIYWLPTTVSLFGLYCNLDLLREHNQKLPQNFNDWTLICDYFTDQGITPIIANNDISLKTLAIGRGFYQVYQEQRQIEVFQRLMEGEEELSLYLKPGFSQVKEIIDRGYLDPEKTLNTKKTSDDLQEFVKGGAPFMITGAWAAGRVAGMKPDFEFQVIPYPALENENLLVINADTRLSVNADSSHLETAMKFVEYFTEESNIQKFADQQSSFSPLRGGKPSSVEEIQPLIPCYESGRTVVGTDNLLELPIWELTAKATEKLLAGEPLDTVMDWLDQQAAAERGAP